MVRVRLPGDSSVCSLFRKECLKMKKDDAQPFENTLLFDFPEEELAWESCFSSERTVLTVGFVTAAAANPSTAC